MKSRSIDIARLDPKRLAILANRLEVPVQELKKEGTIKINNGKEQITFESGLHFNKALLLSDKEYA